MKDGNLKQNIKLLKDYFSKRPDISMAFVFGSYAKGREIAESDFDLAIYFKPEGRNIDWEESKHFKDEDKIWLETERIVKKNSDKF